MWVIFGYRDQVLYVFFLNACHPSLPSCTSLLIPNGVYYVSIDLWDSLYSSLPCLRQ
eukprot:c8787_g1_i1 orf=131-301(+)